MSLYLLSGLWLPLSPFLNNNFSFFHIKGSQNRPQRYTKVEVVSLSQPIKFIFRIISKTFRLASFFYIQQSDLVK